jgi:hypothetical protein
VRVFAGWYRWAFAILTASALGTGFDYSVVSNGFSWVSWFSFFTILSNLSAIAVFVTGAWPWTGKASPDFDFVRGAVVVYMAITGLVVQVLLRHLEVTGPLWVDDVVHKIMPIVVFVDWLLMPPARRIGLKNAMAWLIIPVVYVTYTEIRGPFARWYPYPFLDPRPHGVLHVVLMSVVVAIGFVLVSLLVAALGDILGARRARYGRTGLDH